MLPSSMRAEMLPEVPSTNPFSSSSLAAAQICSGAFSMKVAMAGCSSPLVGRPARPVVQIVQPRPPYLTPLSGNPRPRQGTVCLMGLLDRRVAVVTGAGRGIGRDIALCLAGEGAKVVVNDVGVTLGGEGTAEDPAAAVCKEIEAAGGDAVPNHDSVSDFEAAGRIIAAAVDNFGRIDVVVNNAGIVRDRTLVKMDESDY